MLKSRRVCLNRWFCSIETFPVLFPKHPEIAQSDVTDSGVRSLSPLHQMELTSELGCKFKFDSWSLHVNPANCITRSWHNTLRTADYHSDENLQRAIGFSPNESRIMSSVFSKHFLSSLSFIKVFMEHWEKNWKNWGILVMQWTLYHRDPFLNYSFRGAVSPPSLSHKASSIWHLLAKGIILLLNRQAQGETYSCLKSADTSLLGTAGGVGVMGGVVITGCKTKLPLMQQMSFFFFNLKCERALQTEIGETLCFG